MAYRFLTPAETRVAFDLAKKLHEHEAVLPPEIIETKRKYETAMRLAEAFYAMFHIVDMSLVNDVIELRFKIDRLYGNWIQSETRASGLVGQ